jgi:hypothetical protein
MSDNNNIVIDTFRHKILTMSYIQQIKAIIKAAMFKQRH